MCREIRFQRCTNTSLSSGDHWPASLHSPVSVPGGRQVLSGAMWLVTRWVCVVSHFEEVTPLGEYSFHRPGRGMTEVSVDV